MYNRFRRRRKKVTIGSTSPGEHSDAIRCVELLNGYVGAQPGDWYAIPNETESKREAAKRKREGLKGGASDYCIVAASPRFPEARAIYIELKRLDGKGVESKKQKKFGAGVERHGCLYFVCDGWRDVRAVLEGLGFTP